MFRLFPVFACCMLMVLGGLAKPAFSAVWPPIGVACTPDRVFDPSLPQNANAGKPITYCNCPPASLCPQTYEEYSTPSMRRMPMKMIDRCCPVMESEKCPVGSYFAGQPVPSDGNCNPELCPVGTTHQGEPKNKQINNDCGVTPPPPPVTQCPSKYYPTIAESMTNTNFAEPHNGKKRYDSPISPSRGTYTYQNGSAYDFDYLLGWDWNGKGQNSINIRMDKHFGWSLRLSSTHGIGLTDPLTCSLIGPTCGYNTLISMTDGIHIGHPLKPMLDTYGTDKFSWFGFTVVMPKHIDDNLATPAILADWGSRDIFEIANHSISAGYKAGHTWEDTLRPVPASFTKDAGGFITQCQRVGGEYLELEHKNFGGTQCAYLQCRYIYEDTQESCLSADTKITLADGSVKPVKDLKLGDVVKGSDGDHKITAANTYQSGLRVLYGINGQGAMLTGDHPIRTKAGWKVITDEGAKLYADKPGFAKEPLKVGDVLVSEKGEVKVESITRFPSVNPISTYNIKVDGNNGFYANGIEVKGFSKMEMQYE